VLNAADPQVAKLAELSDGAVIFYALDEHNAVLQQHRAAGGRVAFLRDQHIVLAQNGEDAPLLGLNKLKPLVASQPEAVLAAAAAGWALDVPTDLICAGLRSFENK
jgi:cyanophycin synthetase